MAAIVTNDIRVYNALQFIESMIEPANSTIYTFIGKPVASPVVTPNDNVILQYDIWDNMIAMKRVDGLAHVRSGIRKIMWDTGGNTRYAKYDHSDANLFLRDFYVINPNDNKIYKCLANGNGNVSIIEPTENANTLGNTSLLADGYRWKLMGNISFPDLAKFGTPSFLPIVPTTNYAAPRGGILHVEVVSGGSGYTSSPSVTFDGDGRGAVAGTVTLSAGAVSSIEMLTAGFDYRVANVIISGGGGTGAVARAIISPTGGHGSDPLNELGANYVIINTRIETTDTDFPANVQYHQVGLIRDPLRWSDNTVATASTLAPYQQLVFNTGQTVRQGNVIYQTAGNYSNAYVLGTKFNESTNVIVLRKNDVSSNIYTNYSSFVTGQPAFINGVSLGTVQQVLSPSVRPNTGKVIYVDNRLTISRSVNQAESLSIILEF